MKRILSLITLALAVMLSSCEKTSYQPVTDLIPFETYNVTGNSAQTLFSNEFYEMFVYTDIPKVSLYNSVNTSSCTIYKTANFVDRTSDVLYGDDGLYNDGQGVAYRIFDFEFDMITGTNDDGSDYMVHYWVYMDGTLEPQYDEDGNVSWDHLDIIRTFPDGSTDSTVASYEMNTHYITRCMTREEVLDGGYMTESELDAYIKSDKYKYLQDLM
ncbi:MAG: hypothetical protein SNF73_02065 [Rikenellaceae bacterium]